mgnify:CR=1 FL=1
MLDKLRGFIYKCKRTLSVARKPTAREYWMVARICILGLFIVGLIGFLVKVLSTLIQGGV